VLIFDREGGGGGGWWPEYSEKNHPEQGREQEAEEISSKEAAWLDGKKRLNLKSGDPEFKSKLDRHLDLFLGNLEAVPSSIPRPRLKILNRLFPTS